MVSFGHTGPGTPVGRSVFRRPTGRRHDRRDCGLPAPPRALSGGERADGDGAQRADLGAHEPGMDGRCSAAEPPGERDAGAGRRGEAAPARPDRQRIRRGRLRIKMRRRGFVSTRIHWEPHIIVYYSSYPSFL